MALVPCPECQKEVSTQAVACPQCAFPFPGKHGLSEDSRAQKLSTCPDCGLLISKHARSCPHCGITKLDEQTSKVTTKITQVDEQTHQTTNGNLVEETWLCPHCATPYTRKVRLHGEARPYSQEAAPVLPLDKELQNAEAARPYSQEAAPVLPLDKELQNAEAARPYSQEAAPVLPLDKELQNAEAARPYSQEAAPVLPLDKELQNSEMASVSYSKPPDLGGLLPLRTRSPLWQNPSGNKEISSPSYPRHRKKSVVLVVTIFVLVAVLIALGALWQFQGINPLEVLVYWRM